MWLFGIDGKFFLLLQYNDMENIPRNDRENIPSGHDRDSSSVRGNGSAGAESPIGSSSVDRDRATIAPSTSSRHASHDTEGNASSLKRRWFSRGRGATLRVLGALVLLVFLVSGFMYWYQWYQSRADLRALRAYEDKVALFANDTYGGKTPEETLSLFVDALKAGDVELASKYFVLDAKIDRKQVLLALQSDKISGNLQKIIGAISRAKPVNSNVPGYASFKVLNDEGVVALMINLVTNGRVWKIENL